LLHYSYNTTDLTLGIHLTTVVGRFGQRYVNGTWRYFVLAVTEGYK